MKKRVLFWALLFLAGLGVGLAAPFLFASKVSADWYVLKTPPNHFGMSYATEVVVGDILTPDIKSVSGRAKFLNTVGTGGSIEFGYVVVEMAPLDLSKVPKKYKEEKKTNYEGRELTTLPIDQAYYDITFKFDLLDKDGFVIQQVNGKKGSLVSGKQNTFQDRSEERVPYDTARQIAGIMVHPSIVKCNTCQR